MINFELFINYKRENNLEQAQNGVKIGSAGVVKPTFRL